MADTPQSNLIDLNDYFPKVKTNDPAAVQSVKQTSTTDDIRNLLDTALPAIKSNVGNEFMKGKEKVFGADMDHHKFERYYAHPNFSKLGFNPFLDNEAIYNANSNFRDDFRRTWGQWKTLVSNSFVDAAGFGPATDRDAANVMAKANAIGSSTRGGIGGFTNNLFLNSGYTVGIMAEILAEEAALFVGTAVTGGALGELAITKTAANVSRLTKALFTGQDWLKKSNKVIEGLDAMNDVNVARGVFSSIKSGAIGTGKFIGKQLVPESYQFLSNFNKLENISGAAKTVKGFGAFYRDIRNVRLAFSESAMEGGTVENEMISELYNDFVAKNGRDPNDEEAAKIRNTAKSAGLGTTWTNLPVIYFSNNIVLGSMFKSFSPLRKLIPIAENKFAKTVITKKGVEVLEKTGVQGWKNFGKALISPKAYGTFALSYLSSNLAEGLQESAQDVISGTNKAYYKNLYNNSVRGGYYNALADNIEKQFSAEGLEVFASGFLMGGLLGAGSSIVAGVNEKRLQFFDKDYAAKKTAALASIKRKAATLNEIYVDPIKLANKSVNNSVIQNQLAKDMKAAEEAGDQKLFQDLKNQAMSHHLWTVFETGMEDTFKERFDNLLKLDDKELMEAVPSAESVDQAREVLSELSSKMGEFKKSYDFVKANLSNPFDLSQYKPGSDEYKQEAFGFLAFEEAQKDLVFMRHGVTNTLKRMNGIMNDAVKDVGVKGVAASDITNLFSISDLTQEITNLKQELKTFGDKSVLVTPEAKKLQKDKETKLKHLEAFSEHMTNLFTDNAPSESEVNREIGTGEGKVVFTKENSFSGEKYQKALSAYKAYIKSLSRNNLVSDKNLETAFEKLIDYYKLEGDAKNYNSAVNTLINPDAFREYAARKHEVIEAEYNDRQERLTQALLAYEKEMADNDLLQELYKNNMFFDPKELEALVKEGKMPTKIYNTTGKKDQILSTSPQYNTAVSIFKQYVENVLDIPLQYNEELDAYNTETRAKLPGDTRTYEQIAEQYGFDPTATRTTLPLRDVLQKIIDSEFATEQEQALARRLIKFAKASDTVTFAKDLGAPGIFTEAEQTVIDARYSSEEYKLTAQSYPIEVSILREEVNRRMLNALEDDTQFAEEIEKLRQAAVAYYNDNLDYFDKPFAGFQSNKDFIMEVMTNDEFRSFLSEIKYEDTGSNGWHEFVNKVIEFLNRIFATDSTGTALNAAINVITAKIDATNAADGTSSTGSTTAKRTDPRLLSVEDLRASKPELVDKLLELYKEYNQMFETTDPNLMLDKDYKSKTNGEIEASPQFREFIKGQSDRIIALYDKYFPQPAAGSVREIVRRPGTTEVIPGIPEQVADVEEDIITEEVRQGLQRLGYTDDEIDSWTPYIAKNVLLFGETKDETAKRLANEKEDLDSQREDARDELKELLNSVKTFSDMKAADEFILGHIKRFTFTAGYTADELTKMINDKKREIAFKTDWAEVNEGDYVVINNIATGSIGVYKVEKKTGKRLTLTPTKQGQNPRTINKSDFNTDKQNNLIFKYRPEQEDMGIEIQTITPQEQNVSNDDVNGINDISDEDVVKAINDGKKANPDDTLNDFLDSLDDICPTK